MFKGIWVRKTGWMLKRIRKARLSEARELERGSDSGHLIWMAETSTMKI